MGLEPIVKVGCSDVVNLCSVQGYSISCADHVFQVKDNSKSDTEVKKSGNKIIFLFIKYFE
jgi:hypothetical protein